MSVTEEKQAPTTDVIVRAFEALPPEVQTNQTVERMRIISALSPGLTISDLVYGCILEEETGLSLTRKELYLARGRTKDGQPGQLLAIAGVYGLLANARKHEDFLGWDGDVVREKDEFKVHRTPNGERAIEHSYSGTTEDRGSIKGSWAQVYLKGRPSIYFYAPWDEYAPENPKWGSAWKTTPSAMISKCSLSLCLRRAYSLGAVVGEEEAARWFENNVADSSPKTEIRGIELPPEVEAIIERAEELGHQRHAERSVWEYLLDRGPDAVSAAVSEATTDLDELEKIKDAEVEPDVPIDMEGLPEPSPSTNVAEAPRAAAEAETTAVEDETSEEVPAPEDVGAEVEEPEVNVEALRRRLAELQKKKATTPAEEELRDEEVEWIESKLVAAAEKAADEDEDQGRLM